MDEEKKDRTIILSEERSQLAAERSKLAAKRSTLAAQRSDLAAKRTRLALERTELANERTFSAWIRTGLSSVLAGLSIVNFIGSNEVFSGYVLLIGMLFVMVGIFINITAYNSFKRSFELLTRDKEEASTNISLNFLLLVTIGMTTAALLIAGLLIFL